MNVEKDFRVRICDGPNCSRFNSRILVELPLLLKAAEIRAVKSDCNSACGSAPNCVFMLGDKRLDIMRNVTSPYPGSPTLEDIVYKAIDLKTKL